MVLLLKLVLKNVNVELTINVYYAIQHQLYAWVVIMKMVIMLKRTIQIHLLNAIIVNLMAII